MRNRRWVPAWALVLASAFGVVGLVGGCDSGPGKEGSVVKPDEKTQKPIQDKMKEFMAKKAGAGKSK